ncbi:hypothetical protein BASA82_000165 [Batrachochytrium salamandrivorans]|nr:hypothetical protein BASA82_000165 [Batrachochytrium salamandrivorans]
MEAAFGVLADNPGSDEAVFAALALVSRTADFAQVKPRLYEFWKALDGKVFFKRLFMDKGVLGLNFLALFCFDGQCLLEISQQLGEEVIQTCMTLDGKDDKAIRDGIQCVAGLGSLSGTSMFLLQVLGDGNRVETRELALDAFERTTDPFLFEEDCKRAVGLLSTSGFSSVAIGIANRLEASALSKPTQTSLFALLHAKLCTKGNSAKDRRSLLIVSSAALLFLAPNRQTLLPSKFLVGLAALASIEIRVGLERIASGMEQTDDGQWRVQELPAVLASLEILDRVRCWLLLGEDGEAAEEEDSLLLRSLVSGLDSACLFLRQTSQSPEPLAAALRDLVCGVLYLFWSDDPGSGISNTLGGGNLPPALLVLCQRNLREMLPVLARLDGGLVDSFLGPLYARVEAELPILLGEGQWDLAIFAGLVLLMGGDQQHDIQVASLPNNGASALQQLCLQGVWLVFSPSFPASSFLLESKGLLAAAAAATEEEGSFWAQKAQRLDLANLRRRVVLEQGL